MINVKHVLQSLDLSIPAGALEQPPVPAGAWGVQAFPGWRLIMLCFGLEGDESSTHSAPKVGCTPHKSQTPELLPAGKPQAQAELLAHPNPPICGRMRIKGSFLEFGSFYSSYIKLLASFRRAAPSPAAFRLRLP